MQILIELWNRVFQLLLFTFRYEWNEYYYFRIILMLYWNRGFELGYYYSPKHKMRGWTCRFWRTFLVYEYYKVDQDTIMRKAKWLKENT